MKTIYISGPITDPETGRPREGWQGDFLDAEQKLRRMGFHVINPIEIAKETEEEWNDFIQDEWNKRNHPSACTDTAPRYVYIFHCLQEIMKSVLYGFQKYPNSNESVPLAGLYVIGHPDDIRRSYGTMAEINFALSADMPVWSQYYHGYQMDNLLRQLTDCPTLAEAQQTLNE